MVKYTPGGARNFLVPSRLNPGIVLRARRVAADLQAAASWSSGFERYFQIVRCFRDEDLRLDRQPEFTQIDLEMSLRRREGRPATSIEGLLAALWKGVLGVELPLPFAAHDLRRGDGASYGVDKPDLRCDLELCDVTEAARACGFHVFEKAVARGRHRQGAARPRTATSCRARSSTA